MKPEGNPIIDPIELAKRIGANFRMALLLKTEIKGYKIDPNYQGKSGVISTFIYYYSIASMNSFAPDAKDTLYTIAEPYLTSFDEQIDTNSLTQTITITVSSQPAKGNIL